MKSNENSLLFPYSGVCLGIDPQVDQFEPSSTSCRHAFEKRLENHCRVIEQVDRHFSLKPNLGFFLRFGSWGIGLLENFCARFRNEFPIVLDGKFGEVSTTLEGYLDFAFGILRVQGLTINPFLGESNIEQAVQACVENTAGFGRIFVLCATSQHGKLGDTSEELKTGSLGKLQAVADIIAFCSEVQEKHLNKSAASPIGLVVGAGRHEVLNRADLRASKLPLLCPGLGAQGASFERARALSQDAESSNSYLFPLSRYIFDGGRQTIDQALARIQEVSDNLNHPLETRTPPNKATDPEIPYS